MTLDQALAVIREAGPRQAFLTHISHDMGLFDATSRLLPPGVRLAIDGMNVEIPGE